MEFEKLQAIIADQLSVDEKQIQPDTLFVDDLGADSLEIFQIVMRAERDFDMVLDEQKAGRIKRVEDLLNLLTQVDK